MAPVIMGTPDRPELPEELADTFCRTDPERAIVFARTTFLSDNRADLPRNRYPPWSLSAPRTPSPRATSAPTSTNTFPKPTGYVGCDGTLPARERPKRHCVGDLGFRSIDVIERSIV